jgi:hypothetical protein
LSGEYFNDVNEWRLLYLLIFFRKCRASVAFSETKACNISGGENRLSKMTSSFLQQLSNLGKAFVLELLLSFIQCFA